MVAWLRRGVRSDVLLSCTDTRFQKCSQSGKNDSKHPMLSISTAFNVISCKNKNRLLCKFCSQAQKSLKIPKKNFALNHGLLKFFHLWQLLQAVASFHSYHMLSPALTSVANCRRLKLSLALHPHGDWFIKVLISFMPSQSIALQWIW